MSRVGLGVALVCAWFAAAGCSGRESVSGPLPIPRVAWAGVGVDVGHQQKQGQGAPEPGFFAPNVGISVGGPESLALVACCLGWFAFNEILRSSGPDEDSVFLIGGANVWEGMRGAASDEFLRGFDEELMAKVRELPGSSPPDRPPPGTDVVATAEIGPARRAGAARIHVRVRLIVKGRNGHEDFREERWTQPFTEPQTWDKRAAFDFQGAVAPVVDDLMGAYKKTLGR